jgi:hypothetical protein
MEDGMGMPHGGHALASKMGPSLGRTTGVNADQPMSHGVGPGPASDPLLMSHHHRSVGGGGTAPGYPQDMFMVMDDEVAKPETHGLRPSWTGGMMGMMSLLRVLRPERYDEIMALKVRGSAQGGGR